MLVRLARTAHDTAAPRPGVALRRSMPSARDAKEWAAKGGLHGIGDSLYTPFSGTDGDDIDWDAYRALVRYCVGDLGHSMLWLTSGIAEWWSLTMDERKQLVEVAIEEARAIEPDVVIQACTSAASAKDCVELTQHAEAAGADICYLQTPPMEVHGGEGVLRFFQYVADRTDIALGMFNSPSSGYVLTPGRSAAIANDGPRGVRDEGRHDGALAQRRAARARARARDLGVRLDRVPGGLAAGGHRRAGAARHRRLPARDSRQADPHRVLEPDLGGRIAEAIAHARETRLDRIIEGVGGLVLRLPGSARLLHPLG